MYLYNSSLFKDIDRALGVKKKVILGYSGIAPTPYYRYCQNNDIPILALTNLCDAMHVSISHFIVNQEEETLKDRNEYIVGQGYHGIELRLKEILDDILLYKGLSKTEAMEFLGCNRHELSVWFRNDGKSTLSVVRLLDIMNRMRVWPGNYIIDRNKGIVLEAGYSRRMQSETQMLRRQVEELQNRIKELERRV